MALSAKHELFCREYTKDGNASRAYVAAGYSENGASTSAWRLLKNAQIKNRIAEIQKDLDQEHRITVESIIKDFLKDRAKARELNKPNDAIKATIEIAKIFGYYAINNAQMYPELDGKSKTELVEMALELAKAIETDQPNLVIEDKAKGDSRPEIH